MKGWSTKANLTQMALVEVKYVEFVDTECLEILV
jgi:hypothetical protein